MAPNSLNVTNEAVHTQEQIELAALSQTAIQTESDRQTAAVNKLAEDTRRLREAHEQRRMHVVDARMNASPQGKDPQHELNPNGETQVVTPQKANHHISAMKETLLGAKRGMEDVVDDMALDSNKIAKSEQYKVGHAAHHPRHECSVRNQSASA